MADTDISNQARSAELMYNARAADYNNSWHPQFAADIASWAAIQPNHRVLDLACGSGLVTLAAAKSMKDSSHTDSGHIVSIDIAEDMLTIAKQAAQDQNLADLVTFIRHDITQLETCENTILLKDNFDIITCASCLPLLSNPGSAVKNWSRYLKPGGRIIADVPTAESQIPGIVFEEAVLACGGTVPWSRLWIKNQASLEKLFTVAGLVIEKSFVANGYRSAKGPYHVESGSLILQGFIDGSAGIELRRHHPELLDRIRAEFLERWQARAKDGKVDEVEGFHVVIARRP